MSSELNELYEEIALCRRCELYRSASRAVPGEGPANARLMFIGEAPGFHEDEQGRPFVGAAGQYLNQLLTSAGLSRDQVYITNVIKHRPPANRDPLPGEIDACSVWLDRQIAVIKPKVIITLGRYSMARFFPGKSISRIHGVPMTKDGVIYFPMYHPAAALHQATLRQEIEADMLKLPALLAGPKQTAEPVAPAAQQLSLF